MKLENNLPNKVENWYVTDWHTDNRYGRCIDRPASYTSESEAIGDFRNRCEQAKAEKRSYWACQVVHRTPSKSGDYVFYGCRPVVKYYRARR